MRFLGCLAHIYPPICWHIYKGKERRTTWCSANTSLATSIYGYPATANKSLSGCCTYILRMLSAIHYVENITTTRARISHLCSKKELTSLLSRLRTVVIAGTQCSHIPRARHCFVTPFLSLCVQEPGSLSLSWINTTWSRQGRPLSYLALAAWSIATRD